MKKFKKKDLVVGMKSYTKKVVTAMQMDEDFEVEDRTETVNKGKAGDYLVNTGGELWVSEKAMFESFYE